MTFEVFLTAKLKDFTETLDSVGAIHELPPTNGYLTLFHQHHLFGLAKPLNV